MALAKKKRKAQASPANMIKIACQGASLVELDRLIHFQGKLKALSEANYIKFKNQMIKLGFSEPISVWKNGDDHNVLNGHQRLAVLKRLRDQEGYSIPAIPINLVDATDIKEAKKKVLALTSHYGDMTTESLGNFLIDADLDLGDLRNDFRFLDVEIEPMPEVEFSNDPDRSANTKSSSSSSSKTPEIKLTEYKNEQSDATTHHAELKSHIDQTEIQHDLDDPICEACGQTIIKKDPK